MSPAVAAAIAIALVGCGAGADDPSAPIDRASYCARRAQAVCAAILPCVGQSASGADVAPTMDGCVADETDACEVAAADRASDGLVFDEKAAGECVGALTAGFSGCFLAKPDDDGRLADDAACARVFVGTVPAGGPCLSPRDCAPLADGSAAECLVLVEGALSGECTTAALDPDPAPTPGPTADGEACDDDAQCASTLCFLEACTARNVVDRLSSIDP